MNKKLILPTMTAPTTDEEEEDSSSRNPSLVGRSMLRNLSRDQRHRILLGVLFHRLQRRRNTETPANLIQGEIAQPNRPLRILSHSEALACSAVCRFCLGQANEVQIDDDEEDDNPYLSPCNCSGGSEWVHIQCFRRWQAQAAASTATQQAAQVCTVCRCTYQLQPRSLRSGCLQRGTLLVYMQDNEQRQSSFSRSFVLLLDHTESGGTCGLIVNAPLRCQEILPGVGEVVSTVLPTCYGEGISWRRGGPVSGGRLGVTRYCLAHTLQNLPAATYNSQHLVSRRVLPDQAEDFDRNMLREHLHFVFDATNLNSPAMFREEELGDVMQLLAESFSCQCRQLQQGGDETESSIAGIACKFIVFSGYCKWRGRQLEGEIKRGIWGVCNDTTFHDILEPEPWQDLRYSSARVQSHGDLLEEDRRVRRTEETEDIANQA